MRTKDIKYRKPVGPLILLALLFFNDPLYPQNIINIQPGHCYLSPAEISNSYILTSSVRNSRIKLIPPNSNIYNPNSSFYDSLKVRASRHLVTRKLYDFVVVSGRSCCQSL
jgi:hypothetical protein